jgi:small subunit ribosomal protein S27Ae
MGEEKKEQGRVSKLYKIEGKRLIHLRPFCPRCGVGTFMAEHENRFSCGKCGYTEYKGK